ncbi:MAG: hypothetical protein ABH878_09615 [bacterium]
MIDDPFDIGSNYQVLVQTKLEQVLSIAPPQRTALVIRRVVENLILTERIALQQGVEINEAAKKELIQREYNDVQQEVDRALGGFIGSIVSAEGG